MHPRALNPAVRQSNIDSNDLRLGLADRIRPTISYTEPLKSRLMDAYGASATQAVTRPESRLTSQREER
jgi:hypothetical protein